MADVRAQLALSLMTDFKDFSTFTPAEGHAAVLGAVFDQVVAWSSALAPVRAAAAPAPDAQDDDALDTQSELGSTTA